MHRTILPLVMILASTLSAGDARAAPPATERPESESYRFAQMDIDNDGYLTFEEYSAWHQHWLEWQFRKIDVDNDERLSAGEFQLKGRSAKRERTERAKPQIESPLK